MGVYNMVEHKEECFGCGTIIGDWQTKDAVIPVTTRSGKKFDLDNGFRSVAVQDVDEGTIVSGCQNNKCKNFMKLIEVRIEKGAIVT